MAWSFQLRKNYFCMLNIECPIAHQSSITFFWYTLYIQIIRQYNLIKDIYIITIID